MDVKMSAGDVYFINNQCLVYDHAGIALKLNARNLAALARVAVNYQPIKDVDIGNRRFVVSFDQTRTMFKFEVVGGDRVDVPHDNFFSEVAQAA